MTVALLAVIVLLVAVIGWLLRPGPRERRGGTIDLTPAAARGELDLDWSDPRDHDEWCRAQYPRAVKGLLEIRDANRRLEASRAELDAIRAAHPGIWHGLGGIEAEAR